MILFSFYPPPPKKTLPDKYVHIISILFWHSLYLGTKIGLVKLILVDQVRAEWAESQKGNRITAKKMSVTHIDLWMLCFWFSPVVLFWGNFWVLSTFNRKQHLQMRLSCPISCPSFWRYETNNRWSHHKVCVNFRQGAFPAPAGMPSQAFSPIKSCMF